MTAFLRTFIAVELSPNHKKKIAEIQNKLISTDADVKWVAPENCHITLKFLGQTPETQIDLIRRILDEIAQHIPSFEIELGVLGAFPSVEKPEVIWIGLNKGGHSLNDLSKILEERLVSLGFPKEARTFTPHITIGRVRTNHKIKELSLSLHNTPVLSTTETAHHISLVQSVLSSQGPQYTTLYQVHLK